MKIAIINGLEGSDRDLAVINSLLADLESANYDVKEIRKTFWIESCRACNCCWVKTPGKCSINDKGQYLSFIYNTYDIIVFISYVYFGSYSPWIKSILERLISNILPYFEDRGGRMYHSLRNNMYPCCIFIGVNKYSSGREELDIFRRLTFANTINMTGREKHHYLVIDLASPEEDAEKIKRLIMDAGDDFEDSCCQLQP